MPEPLDPSAFRQVDPAEARLGQLLFYDPILSGNRNISCGTCHNHDTASADRLALGIGEGGQGVGKNRVQGRAKHRQSRNAPGLWNLGAKDVRTLFHDGRVFMDDTGALHSPAGKALPNGLSGVLAAQALFPMIARTEMAGDPGENPIADARDVSAVLAWDLIAKRVQGIESYVAAFQKAQGAATGGNITIAQIANALAAFIAQEWQVTQTPFDQFLRGDTSALNQAEQRGMALFFGSAQCGTCHSGTLLSDQQYHALGLPQFGPGLTRQFDPVARDVGRMGATDDVHDAYRFRTPMLRNVAKTGPYGHNGAYATLRGMIEHHANPIVARQNWKPDSVYLPPMTPLQKPDFAITTAPLEAHRLTKTLSIQPVSLTQAEIADLENFLHSLSDPINQNGRLGKPKQVPSGLPVD